MSGQRGRSRNVGTILLDDAENTQLFALLGKGCVVSGAGGGGGGLWSQIMSGQRGRSRNVGTILLDDAENTQLFALLGKGCVVSRGGSVEPDNVGTEGPGTWVLYC